MQTKYYGISSNLNIELSKWRKCQNIECNKYIPDNLQERGFEAKYCSTKCGSRARYLKHKLIK